MSESVDTLMRDLEQELGVRGPAAVLRAALKIAKEAAAEAKQSEPPAPPAWMVEAARGARAAWAHDLEMPGIADAILAGAHDEEPDVLNSIRALRLALERGHVVEPRPVPSEEEMLKAAREDAAQVWDRERPHWSQHLRTGEADGHEDVLIALQARRNMLKEGAVAVASAAPSVDLEAALKTAWDAGYSTSFERCRDAVMRKKTDERDRQTAIIVASLPTREA